MSKMNCGITLSNRAVHVPSSFVLLPARQRLAQTVRIALASASSFYSRILRRVAPAWRSLRRDDLTS